MCASDRERRARIIVTDEDGDILMESAEYSVYLDGTEEPVTIVAAFDLPASCTASTFGGFLPEPPAALRDTWQNLANDEGGRWWLFPLAVPWAAAGLVLGGTLVLATLAGLAPALQAVRLNIAEAVAHE